MIGLTNKGAIVCLSICLGLVLFGVSTALTNFNRLVDPRHPLQLLEWQRENGQRELSLLGENLSFQLDRSLPDRLARQAREQVRPVMYEVRGYTATLKDALSAGQWPEQVTRAVQAARSLLLEFRERLQWWLDRYCLPKVTKTTVAGG